MRFAAVLVWQRHWRVRAAKLALLAAVSLAVTGCTGDQPLIAPVRGLVTLDGKPLAGKQVVFSPASSGRASIGVTDASGAYELYYSMNAKGAIIGEHGVTISTPLPSDGNFKGWSENVPEKYRGTESTLTAEVQNKKNSIDFSLVSD